MIKVILVVLVGLGLNLGTLFVDSKEIKACNQGTEQSAIAGKLCSSDFVTKQVGFPVSFQEQALEANDFSTKNIEDFTKQIGSNFSVVDFFKNQAFWMVAAAAVMGLLILLRNVAGTMVLVGAAAAAIAAYLGLITLS